MSDLSFSIYGDSAAVTGCSAEASGSLTIPAAFEGHPVTCIQGEALAGCSKISAVTVPNNLERIDFGAFFGCTALEKVTLSASVVKIGEGAFEGCSSLAEINLQSVEDIAEDAFLGCESLDL